jgi:CBS domain-containing protein
MSGRIDSFLIGPESTVLQAMSQLEDSAQKILFVTGPGRRLIGALTDGDIRRWILAGGALEHEVDDVCHRDPMTVAPDYDVKVVRSLMLEDVISCVPVIDALGEVVDLLFWEDVFRDGSEHKPARSISLPVVIMAGGKGTRLDPFTRVLPKFT